MTCRPPWGSTTVTPFDDVFTPRAFGSTKRVSASLGGRLPVSLASRTTAARAGFPTAFTDGWETATSFASGTQTNGAANMSSRYVGTAKPEADYVINGVTVSIPTGAARSSRQWAVHRGRRAVLLNSSGVVQDAG